MRYRQLASTPISISEKSLGTWLSFGVAVSERQASRLVEIALEHGVNLIDTADSYAGGEAERMVGRILPNISGATPLIATKCFFSVGDDSSSGLARGRILRCCEASLQRLGRSHIDLYQCHRYDPATPLEETIAAMAYLIETGKVRFWGVSQWPAEELSRAVVICDENGWPRPVSNQVRYNLLDRGVESHVIPVCERLGVSLLVYSPLAQGVLTGKYADEEIPPQSRASRSAAGIAHVLQRANQDLVRLASRRARAHGISLHHAAIAWCLRQQIAASAILGASTPEQLADNLHSTEPSAEILDELGDLLSSAYARE